MRVTDFGLHNQNIDMIILFACLVGWLDSSLVEIEKRIKAQSLKNWSMSLVSAHTIAH